MVLAANTKPLPIRQRIMIILLGFVAAETQRRNRGGVEDAVLGAGALASVQSKGLLKGSSFDKFDLAFAFDGLRALGRLLGVPALGAACTTAACSLTEG